MKPYSMKIDPQKPQRKSTRLKDFDYRSAGLYFVTILTDGRKPALSSIKDNNIILSDNCKGGVSPPAGAETAPLQPVSWGKTSQLDDVDSKRLNSCQPYG